MELAKKFVSRKLFVLVATICLPVIYQGHGVTENVTLAIVGICGTYILGQSMVDKNQKSG
jgi:hypothetical protein